MKKLMTITILTSLLSLSAFANNGGEASTDCPWADQSGRTSSNTKQAKEAKKQAKVQGSKGTKI